MQKQKLIVVGSGMAATRTIEHLLTIAPDRYAISVYGAEPHPNYNRILLSPVLAGEMTVDDIILNDRSWYEEPGITLNTGVSIAAIDRIHREVVTATGARERYDRLLIATGSSPFKLPVPGINLSGVITYRDIADTEAMIAATRTKKRAVVIGGGLLGLEAANGLKARGMEVTVVHVMPWLMERQLDQTAAGMLLDSLRARGIDFLLSAQTLEIIGKCGEVSAIRLAIKHADSPATEYSVSADLVVMAVGIRPNVSLAVDAGLRVEKGIVVDDTMQTYDPRIYAVGECVAHRGMGYGLVAPLYEMAKVAAAHLAHAGITYYAGSVVSTKLKVTGIDLFSAGEFMGGRNCEEVVLKDRRQQIYKKLVLKNGKLVGGVLIGDTAYSTRYLEWIKSGADVQPVRHELFFLKEAA